jgi:hypothetical protein
VRPRRLWIAAVWLAGAIVPLVLMAVFLFGCCVLPLHQYVHHAMPFCGGIVKLLASAPEEQPRSTAPRAQERTKQAPVVMAHAGTTTAMTSSLAAQTARPAPREELRHGAARCDHDVGLHLLHATFLI